MGYMAHRGIAQRALPVSDMLVNSNSVEHGPQNSYLGKLT